MSFMTSVQKSQSTISAISYCLYKSALFIVEVQYIRTWMSRGKISWEPSWMLATTATTAHLTDWQQFRSLPLPVMKGTQPHSLELHEQHSRQRVTTCVVPQSSYHPSPERQASGPLSLLSVLNPRAWGNIKWHNHVKKIFTLPRRTELVHNLCFTPSTYFKDVF